MPHVTASIIVNPRLQYVDIDRKIKCPLCGQKSAWFHDVEDESGVWAAREVTALRMRRLAVNLYFATNAEAYMQEFQEVLALPL